MLTIEEIINKIESFPSQKKQFNFKPTDKLTDCTIRKTSLDPLGLIIFKDDKIYRGIYRHKKDYFVELYNTGILQVLSDIGYMPEFKITNFYTDEFPIILEVEKLPIINSVFWSFTMRKKEARLKLQLIEILKKYGYGLIDGHCDNATFKDGKPIFFDFGSIAKNNDSLGAYCEIYTNSIVPMIMLQLGDYLIARNLPTIEAWIRVQPQVSSLGSYEVKSAINRFKNFKNFKILKKIRKLQPITTKEFDILFEKNYHQKTFWANYSDNLSDNKISDRFGCVINKIKKYSPQAETFLDLAGNSGNLSHFICKENKFKRIVSVDIDEMAIEKGIMNFNNDNITFLLANIILLPPVSFTSIIKSDVVCALAIIHHLLLVQKFSIDFILIQLKEYVNKHLYIEFCPLGLYSSDYPDIKPDVPDWYNVEWFEENFKKHFKLIDKETISYVTINGKQYPHRILFVGEV